MHLAEIGHPLAVDFLYGRRRELYLSDLRPGFHQRASESGLQAERPPRPLLARCPLHARRIEFQHPVTRQPVCVEAPMPPDMEAALKLLRKLGRRG